MFIVLCGNKLDVKERKEKAKAIAFPSEEKLAMLREVELQLREAVSLASSEAGRQPKLDKIYYIPIISDLILGIRCRRPLPGFGSLLTRHAPATHQGKLQLSTDTAQGSTNCVVLDTT